MCGRFTLRAAALTLQEAFGLGDVPPLPARYNVDARYARQLQLGSATAEIILELKNVFNTDPPVDGQGPSSLLFYYAPDNPSLYDRLGRMFHAGVRFKL